MRIFGWQSDTSGCGTYRIRYPMEALNTVDGIDAEAAVMMPTDVAFHGAADVIVGQRLATPSLLRTWRHLSDTSAALLVMDLDDDLWNVEPHNPTYGEYTPDRIRVLEDALRMSDVVTVSTDSLAERVAPFNSNVHVRPNAVPDWLVDYEPNRSDDVLTIGWAGSSTHDRDWQECANYVRKYIDRTPGTELHTMGGLQAKPAPRNYRHTGWSSSVDDYLRSPDFHVGLAPLSPSCFNRSKSDLRIKELCALGIVPVASQFGPYARTVVDGVNGFLVDQPHNWAKTLSNLDVDTCADMAPNLRHIARTTYTMSHQIGGYLHAYQATAILQSQTNTL